jgi:hypothetical protein
VEQVAVVAGLAHPGRDPQPHAAVGTGDQLDLVHVESELVEPGDTPLDVLALLARGDRPLAGQLVPQRPIAGHHVLGEAHRVEAGPEGAAGVEVEHLPRHVLERQVDVGRPLAVGQRRVQLGRLGVDQVGGQRARVEAEQRVRQRAVAPEEPGQVQAHEQLDQGVDQLVGRVHAAGRAEQRPVGGRVVEVAGDQGGVEVRAPLDHDAERGDRGDAEVRQPAQQPVLPPGQPLGQLLDHPQHPALGHEPDDVAVDARFAGLDQPGVGPGGQRVGPRQVEQAGALAGGRGEHEPHRSPPAGSYVTASGCGVG